MSKTSLENKNTRTLIVNQNQIIDMTNTTKIKYKRITDNKANTYTVAICIHQDSGTYIYILYHRKHVQILLKNGQEVTQKLKSILSKYDIIPPVF